MSEHVRDRLLDYLYEELDDGARREVETHLDGCETCQAAYADLSGTRALMSGLPEEAPARGVEFVVQAAEREARLRRERPAGPLGRLGAWIAGHPVSTSLAVASVAVLVVVTVDRGHPGGIVASPTAAAPAQVPAEAPVAVRAKAPVAAHGAAPAGGLAPDQDRSLKALGTAGTGRWGRPGATGEAPPRTGPPASAAANAPSVDVDGQVAAKDEDAALRTRRRALERKRLATIQVIKGGEATRGREQGVAMRRSRAKPAKKQVLEVPRAKAPAGPAGGLGVGGLGTDRLGIGGLGTRAPRARAERAPPAHQARHHRAHRAYRAHHAEAPRPRPSRAEAVPRAEPVPEAAAAPRAETAPRAASRAPAPPPATTMAARAEAPVPASGGGAAAVDLVAPAARPARLDAAIRALDAHAPTRALALLDALLAGHPHGPWVAEARYQRCRSLAALGRTAAAARDCRVVEAGGGPFADRARRLLDHLSKTTEKP